MQSNLQGRKENMSSSNYTMLLFVIYDFVIIIVMKCYIM